MTWIDTQLVIAAAVPLFLILSWIVWVDFRSQIIPDQANVLLLLSGLAQSLLANSISLPSAMLGCAIGGTAMYGLRLIYYRMRGVQGLGLGDVKFMAAAGAWVGALNLPFVLLLGCLSALFYVVINGLRQGYFDAKTRIAFGPFLAIGLFVVWVVEHV